MLVGSISKSKRRKKSFLGTTRYMPLITAQVSLNGKLPFPLHYWVVHPYSLSKLSIFVTPYPSVFLSLVLANKLYCKFEIVQDPNISPAEMIRILLGEHMHFSFMLYHVMQHLIPFLIKIFFNKISRTALF